MSRTHDNGEQIDRKTIHAICEGIGERLQQNVRPLQSELPYRLEHLLNQLREQERRGHGITPQ